MLTTGDQFRFRSCNASWVVTGAAEGLAHEAADGARAAAAPGAAAETAIDLAGRARPLGRDGGADILIAQHIA